MHRRWGIPRDIPDMHRLRDESDAYTSPAADSSASAHSRAAAHSRANTRSSTAPVLHWSRGWMRCPLLFGRLVWRERIELQCLRRHLVRRLFTGSSTNTCSEPNSYTSGSDAERQPIAYTEVGVPRMQG